jgi:hypothetical protein
VRKRRAARFCSACIAKKPKKTCAECGAAFQIDMMSGPRCRPCASSKAHEKRVGDVYGLRPGQYAELLAFQGGGDAVTGQKPRAKRLAVDHDHATGEVRGLLLKHTNFYVIGWLESFDDPFAILDALRQYLEHPPAKRLWGDDVPKQPT